MTSVRGSKLRFKKGGMLVAEAVINMLAFKVNRKASTAQVLGELVAMVAVYEFQMSFWVLRKEE